MAVKSTFTPKASLTDAPTNLKEAIDWVLRVTGRDGKELNKETECICGLAAAVTDLLQSVQLEYHGYQGEGTDPKKGANSDKVKEHLNGLFSLVQGLGGTVVVRTYIDQLAQVLSALVGWSSITKCGNGGDKCTGNSGNGYQHGKNGCTYLEDVKHENKCKECECMKWEVTKPDQEGTPLGRKCTRCKDSGDSDSGCQCSPGGSDCTAETCKCALAGKCCKCCCKGHCDKCKDAKCSCVKEDKENNGLSIKVHGEAYQSAYISFSSNKHFEQYGMTATWKSLLVRGTAIYSMVHGGSSSSQRRHHCARTLLGSVCLIWSGLTYMYWTGKYHKTSPRWNNHILDGSGLDDGTLSQWLQALGFPKTMLNDAGPGNRLDAVIWNGLREKLFWGFTHPTGLRDVNDHNDNTARQPAGMNFAGFVHTIHRDSFNTDAAIVFPKNDTSSGTTERDQNKIGAIFKLYILSCAYFTGLQKRNSESTPRTPKTIREILYWLSALPYSPAYPKILTHSKGRLKEVLKKPDGSSNPNLSFLQEGRNAPITVDEYNLFAHFQAVTQYCPLVLIGIQGGLHSATKGTNEPAIHSLYANTECNFTYPAVSIQAYNQVVHYIRALFYQLYFLRKQCAVKVALGGKWRECRYGHGVESKGVISWMCLGCSPMEHDRNYRVGKVKGELDGVKEGADSVAAKVKALLGALGEVVVQLGNAQEALEGKKKEAIQGVKTKLTEAKKELVKAKKALETAVNGGLKGKLETAKEALGELTNGGGGALHTLANGSNTAGSLHQVATAGADWQKEYSSAKDKISEVIHKIQEVLTALQTEVPQVERNIDQTDHQKAIIEATNRLIHILEGPKCPGCDSHSTKCGIKGTPTMCKACGNMTTTGVPSPLQAFLEDRLPGFSCEVVRSDDKDDPTYPPAASHLGHCNGSGQCCPLPMGFRGQFQKRVTNTGQRLYGILYFFSNENMMQSCVYTLVRVTAALSATTPQVLGDVFGFFRGGVGNKERGKPPKGEEEEQCGHDKDPKDLANKDNYFCGWCASGLREEVKKIEWIPKGEESKKGGKYRESVGTALIEIKGDKGSVSAPQSNNTSLSRLTKNCQYLSPLTGELYTAVSATFGNTYLSWVLYLSDGLQWGLQSLASEFQQIECRGCKGQCDPNKCRKGHHGQGSGQCGCQSIVSCTGVLPVLYRHGFSYGNPFNLEGYRQGDGTEKGDYSIENTKTTKRCHEFLESLKKVIDDKKEASKKDQETTHPLSNLLTQVGKLQYDIRLPWIFVLTLAWLMAVLYLAFGAIWPLDWTHMRSHWLRGGAHQWQCMWYKVMTGRKGMELVEYFGRR